MPSCTTSLSPPARVSPTSSISRAAKATNLALEAKLRRGDVGQGLRRGRPCVRARVSHPEMRTSGIRGPFASIADARDDSVTIYTGSQGPSFRAQRDRPAARLVGEPGAHQGAVPRRRLRLQALHQARGAGDGRCRSSCGGRSRSRSPWRSSSTRSPSIRARCASRPGSTRMAASPRANAKCTGTAAPMPMWVRRRKRTSPASSLRVPTTSTTSRSIPTRSTPTMTPAGALRGFGLPQLAFAYESHTDMIARGAQARSRRVSSQETSCATAARQASGTILEDAPLEAVLDHVCERMDWRAPFDRGTAVIRRGAGAWALRSRPPISPTTSVAIINVAADGQRHALYRHHRHGGRGSDTGMAQIVGELLNVSAETVKVVPRDTSVTPYDMGHARLAPRCSIWATPCASPPRRCEPRSLPWRR